VQDRVIQSYLTRKLASLVGPVKVTGAEGGKIEFNSQRYSYNGSTRITPGYNYTFEVKNDEIVKVISRTVDVVIYTENKVLLIKRKNQPFAGSWALPGGFIDPGETPEAAAKRELKEETGVASPALQYVGRFDTPNRDPRMEHVWSDAFKAEVPNEIATHAADDASDAQWIPISQLKSMNFAFDHGDILNKALGGR